MIYRAVILLGIILSYSCQNKKAESSIKPLETDTLSTEKDSIPIVPKVLLEEYFTDSLTIGRKGKNKVELFKYKSDSIYVILNFYSLVENKWVMKDSFEILKDGITNLEAIIEDYDIDGFSDISFISSVAARGANEMRTLFIYNAKGDNLIHLKNSHDYANLRPNKELKCVDAFNVYGGSTSFFLNVLGDSLKPFAYVQLFHGLTISEYDKYGNVTVIFRDTSVKKSYGRYKSYQPLIEYDEY